MSDRYTLNDITLEGASNHVLDAIKGKILELTKKPGLPAFNECSTYKTRLVDMLVEGKAHIKGEDLKGNGLGALSIVTDITDDLYKDAHKQSAQQRLQGGRS